MQLLKNMPVQEEDEQSELDAIKELFKDQSLILNHLEQLEKKVTSKGGREILSKMTDFIGESLELSHCKFIMAAKIAESIGG